MTSPDIAGRRYVVDDAGVRAVSPVPDRGPRLVVDGRVAELEFMGARPTESGGLAWRLVGEGLAADLRVEAADTAGAVARVNLTVTGTGRLQHVDVEQWATSPGLGQPVLGDGWFAALEHPGAEDLGLAVDHDLAAGPFVAPPLVVGTAPPGDELAALWDEVDRVRPCPPRLVVLANNWYQLGYVGRMNEATVAAELDGFAAVGRRHDLDLDWYCLDDPWDGQWEAGTGLWGRLDPSRFAGLPAGAAGIGLWVSPWGGYFDRHDARVAWGGEHGFEVHDGSWPRLCPAGDRYRAHVAASMARFTEAGVGYWKIDGVQFDCPHADHGHATGPGGRTDQMDRFAGLLDGVRAVRPDVVLAFTTGSNPSPWWLKHADFIWRGGLDDDAPAEYDGGRHERFATYIDGCLDAFRPSSVPVSAVVTFSIVENGARAYRDEGDGLDAWQRHCWLLAARGTHHHDLYVAPDSLSEAEWDVLAHVLRWARQHQAVLARSRMIGGRPQAGEAYGFMSVDTSGEAILCVRNPTARPQPSPALPGGGELIGAEPVFGRWTGELAPFEVAVVSGRWRPRPLD
ncbi:MAG: hypothetical protein ACRD12_18675 [Acidimicrobiales bacterium]